MANGGQIRFGIGFQVDKSGLSDLQSSLKQVQIEAQKVADRGGQVDKKLQESAKAASDLERILNQSWNGKLNQLDLSKFNKSVKDTYGSIGKMKQVLEQSGAAGRDAFNHIASSILNTNVQIKQSNKLLDDMATSMANTVKWGITSSIFNTITQSISKAYNYTKKLDSSLNDIRIVTDKSSASMEKFAKQANNAAKGLGASTLDYTEASLIYYQQGLSDGEVTARTDTTLKAANVTGQYASEVSDQLTAVWNGYKVSAEETELYVDKLSAVAATTATDLSELSAGMSKVASAANNMGVDVDQLNAQLATIVSVTREAPESVGTALKTIYARMGDLKIGGVDEDGIGLGEVSSQMEAMGIDVLDAKGELRDMGTIIEDVAAKWATWSDAERTAMAQVMAGKRQYNNLIALFDNWGMYSEALETSANSAGTLQKQQDTYMESTEAHLQQLRTEAEQTYDILFDQGVVNGFVDSLTNGLNVFNNFLSGLGGGFTSVVAMGGIIANIFSKQIGNAVTGQIAKTKEYADNLEKIRTKENLIKELTESKSEGETSDSEQSSSTGNEGATSKGQKTDFREKSYDINDEITIKAAENAKAILSIQQNISQEKYNELTALQQQIELDSQKLANIDNYNETLDKMLNNLGEIEDAATGEKIKWDKNNKSLEKAKALVKEKTKLLDEDNRTHRKNLDIVKKFNTTEKGTVELTKEEAKVLVDAFGMRKGMVKTLEDGTKVLDTTKVSQQEINDYIEKQNALIKDNKNAVQQMNMALMGMEADEEGLSEELREQITLNQSILDAEVQQSQEMEKVANATEAASAAMALFGMGAGVIKTLNDETLSLEEKFQQVGTVLVSSIPLIISFGKNFKDMIPGAISMMNGLTTSITGTAVSTGVAQGGVKGLTASFLELMSVAWPFLAIGAALAAVAVAIGAMIKEHNKDAAAAKESAEQVEALTNRYNELTEAANNFKNTVSDYSDAKKALSELEKGTDEYKQKLEEVNDKARELIETYGLWDDYTIGSDGVINIDENALAEKQAEMDNQANSAKNMMYGAKIYNEEAQLRNERTNAKRSIGDVVGYQSDDGYDYRQLSDDETQEIIAAVQKANEEGTGGLSLKEFVANNISDTLSNSIDAIFTEENEKAFQRLAESASEAAAAQEYYASQIIGSIAEEQYGDKVSEIADGDAVKEDLIMAGVAKQMEKADAEAEAGLADQMAASESQIKNINSTGELESYLKKLGVAEDYNVSNDKELALTYAEMMGYGDRESLSYKGGWGKGSVTDANGNKVLDNMNDEVMRREIAKQATFKKLQEDYAANTEGDQEAYLAAVEKMMANAPEAGKKYGVDFSTAVLENLANGDLENFDLSSLFTELDPTEVENLKELNADELMQVLGINEQDLIDMGYESAAAFEQAFDQGLNEYDPFTYWDAKLEQSKANIETLNSSIEKMKNGNELSTEEIQALEEEFPELGNIIDKTSQTYLRALEQLQEAQEEAYQTDLIGSLNSAYGELGDTLEKYNANSNDYVDNIAEADGTVKDHIECLQDMQGQLQAIYDREYKLEIAEVDDLLSDVDNLITKADGLQLAFESIGDGFTLAADKSEALFDIFPELAKNAEVLANGTIQLDDEVVKAVLGNNGEIIDSDKAVLTQAIQNKIAEIDAEEARLEAEIQRVENMTALEFKHSGIVEEIAKSQATNEVTIDEKKTTDMVANDGAMTTAVIDNWAKKAEAAKQYAGIAADALLGKVSEVTIDPEKFDVNTEVSTQNTVGDVNTSDDLGLWEEMRKDYLNSLYNELDMQRNNRADLIAGMSMANYETSTGYTEAMNKNDKNDSKDKKEEKKAEDEIDRYWELNKAIEETEESLSDLDKKQEKLYGKEKIKSLEEENKLLDKQIENHKALAAEQAKEAGELQGILSQYGVAFNDQGAITNYLEASQRALNDYNQAVLAYNQGAITEAAFQAAETSYNTFKNSLSRYESVYQSLIDTQNKVDEDYRKKLENNLEAWEIEIQLKLDMNDLRRQWNEFFREVNKNFRLVNEDLSAVMDGLVEDAKTYTGKDGDITTQINAINDVMKEIDNIESGKGSDKFASISEAQEHLKKLSEDLMSSASEFQALREQAWQTYLDGIDQTADGFDHLMDQFDRINENLEYQKELIELLYGDEAYDMMSEYYDAQLNNTGAQIDSSMQQAEFWKKQYEEAKRIDEINGTTSEDTKKFYENWQAAQQKVNEGVTTYIKLLQDDYKNTINQILDDLQKKAYGFDLDEVKEQWEILQKQAEGYYDGVEKVYQLSTLSNKYEQSIANTASLKNQQKLQELYNSELKYLKEKKNLTEYDMQIANAKYDMALKQIALEEAQQNKNAMKMTRGADGNWSYQYVADEGDVASKQQELADSMNNYYQVAKDGLQDLANNVIETTAEYNEKVAEIAADTSLKEDERQEKLEELYEQYYGDNGILTNLNNEYENRKRNMADATLQSVLGYYQIDKDNYALMTQEEQSLIDGLKDGTISNYDQMLIKAEEVCGATLNFWDSAAMSVLEKWSADNGTSVKAAVVQAYEDIKQANSEYQTAVDDLAERVGQDFGPEGIKGALDTAQQETNDLKDDTKTLVETAEKQFPKYRKQIEKIEEAWEKVKDKIEVSIEKIEEYLGKIGDTKDETDQLTISMQNAANAIRDAAAAQRELNAAKNDAPSTSPETTTTDKSMYYYLFNGKDTRDSSGNVVALYNIFLRRTNTIVDGNMTLGDAKKKYGDSLKAFDTGGYTGEWNNGDTDGRLAWLHQKELILNAADTKNILAVVDTVREMTRMSNSIESAIMQNIGKMVGSLMNLGSYEKSYQPVLATTEGTTENIFHINAEFPNANDVTSIREAILSLPNLASQHMMARKK